MLPFGLRDGVLVSINDVERGLQKNVVCPSCQTTLVARKGKLKIPHFAHYNGDECLTGLQTVLHIRAKEIIAETKSIFVPEHSIKLPGRTKPFEIISPQKVTLDEVWLEKRLDKIIPDVFAKTHDKELLIEIRVSHAVEQTKIDLLKRMNLRAIEVDLSDFIAKGYDDEVLRERLIEQHERKKWLSSPKFNSIKEDVLMTTIHRVCSWVPYIGHAPFWSYTHYIPCPDLGRKHIFYGDKCWSCEYNYGDIGAPATHVYCGYYNRIKNYDSLLQCIKRKNKK